MSFDKKILTLEEGWDNTIKPKAVDKLESLLEEGITRTSNKEYFTNKEFSDIYTVCYDMCVQPPPFNWSEELYRRHGDTIAEYLMTKVLPSLQRKRGEELLIEFVKRGENHTIMNKWYSKLFKYLDRFHVKYQQIPSLLNSGFLKYKQIVFDAIKSIVTPVLLEKINMERDVTGSIDRHLIKSCINIYVTMGMDSLDVYDTDFVTDLIQSTRQYYNIKSQELMQKLTTSEYLTKVDSLLEEERNRVKAYLQESTEVKLIFTVEQELLVNHQKELIEKPGSGMRDMLTDVLSDPQSKALDHLELMYRLLKRTPTGLDLMSKVFKEHIQSTGRVVMAERTAAIEAAKASKDREGNEEAQFVTELISLQQRCTQIVHQQFHLDSLFQKSLNEAFTELVNSDPGVKPFELIANYCDRLLKSGSAERLTETAIEEQLDRIVLLFSLLNDKDMFAETYRNQLAKRILASRSASDDMERSMIGKFKIRCGAQFTSKMVGMLNDLSLASDSNRQFEEFCRSSGKLASTRLSFSAQVLTTGNWPQYKTFNDMRLPSTMQRCIDVFQEHYNSRTDHRRLTWTFALGNAEVKINLPRRSYEATVTTLQAAVMLYFNTDMIGTEDNAPLAFKQLLDSTALPVDVLKKVLHSLSCGKIKVISRTSDDPKIIRETDTFKFNDSFSSTLKKFRIPMANLEDNSNPKRVEEDRSMTMDAAIVRIMKSRKTLGHQQLVAEVLTQLQLFKPEPRAIKKRIESLIEREYLQRDPDCSTNYNYLA